jgi:hypothetical protein
MDEHDHGTTARSQPKRPVAEVEAGGKRARQLMATALNNEAVAALIASVVGPTASELYGITNPKAPYW